MNPNQKVIIIGSGISGLTAGYYARKCGYDTLILEKHRSPGGLCTSWKRKDYLIEGSIHWLTGSNPKSNLYKSWCEIGALNDNVKVSYNDPFFQLKWKGTEINCYRNLDKFINELNRISPEDSENIKRLKDYLEFFIHDNNPLIHLEDLEGVKLNYPVELKDHAPDMKLIIEMISLTAEQYGKKYKNEALQQFFNVVFGAKSSALFVFISLGTYMSNDGGFPEGGSSAFVERIVNKYKSIGGKIELKTKVDKILAEGNVVKGVMVDGKMMNADYIFYTGDIIYINNFLEKPLTDPQFLGLEKIGIQKLCTFVSLGYKTDLSKYPHLVNFDCTPFKCGADEISYIDVHNYSTYEGFSPKGTTLVTVLIIQSKDSYDWWKKAKENGTYAEEKKKISQLLIDEIAKVMPETKDKIDVIDVATPLTYERYVGAYAGSYMNMMASTRPPYNLPPKCKDYNNLYFAGERIREPGGLPIALLTGRKAVQMLCKDNDKVFMNEEMFK